MNYNASYVNTLFNSGLVQSKRELLEHILWCGHVVLICKFSIFSNSEILAIRKFSDFYILKIYHYNLRVKTQLTIIYELFLSFNYNTDLHERLKRKYLLLYVYG